MRILILGDSWCDPQYLQVEQQKQYNKEIVVNLSFPYWTERMAMSYDVTNLSCTGCSNDYIFDQFVEHHKQYDKIIILWSAWNRYGLYTMLGRHTHHLSCINTVNYMNIISQLRPETFQMQGTFPIEAQNNDRTEIQQKEYESLIFNVSKEIIRRNQFFDVHGWPIFNSIGGFTMASLLYDVFGKSYQIVWGKDIHPNEKSHEYMYSYIKSRI